MIKPEKKCRKCNVDCFGTYCRSCYIKNKHSKVSRIRKKK